MGDEFGDLITIGGRRQNAQAAVPLFGARAALMIARIATTVIGVVLIVYGVIAAISPLPLGVPLVVLGLFMIAGANPAFRPVIRSMRRKWRWFDKLVHMAAPRARGAVRTVIAETDPARQDRRMDEDAEDAAAAGDANKDNDR